ncbi:MAG: DEAD/DEAH box helicase [Bacilli bacterium]
MNFKELGLSKSLLEVVEKQNYIEPTLIQQLAIPHILNNVDIMGVAQTGTGKTAAFSLPILEKLYQENNPNQKIKVLILSPTRELALQIRDNIRNFSSDSNFKCSVILGGVNQNSQIEVLKKGVDILVATPGRLLDLVKRKYANLSNVKMLVLDEADTMLDMGFINDVRQIVSKIPSNRQTMLFSATMPKEIKELANEFLKNPVIVTATPLLTTVPKIKQLLYYVDKNNKFNLLLELLKKETVKSTLIFTRTKRGANKLGDQLRECNINVSVIHGNKSQNDRIRNLSDFKTGKTNIMVATDIAARGIDINELSHVINYDMPEKAEIYVHRIGRTARAGHEGISISLCSIDEKKNLKAIENLIKQQLEVVTNHNYPMIVTKEEVKTVIKPNFSNRKISKENKPYVKNTTYRKKSVFNKTTTKTFRHRNSGK